MSASIDTRPSEHTEGSGNDRKRIDYFYDALIGNFNYGEGHPMRPHRVRLTHNLVVRYGLFQHLNVFRPKPASKADLNEFHTDDYLHFLSHLTPDNMQEVTSQLDRFNLGADCPVFDGMFEYCQAYTGGSIGGAARLNQGCSDIVINWSGGMHHAKKGEASGFCYGATLMMTMAWARHGHGMGMAWARHAHGMYTACACTHSHGMRAICAVNDIVLAILELLKVWQHQQR